MSWDAAEHEGLKYRFHLPQGYGEAGKKWPVVLYLHGSGERGTDNASHLKNGVDQLASWPCIVLAPQCPPNDSWGGHWFPEGSHSQSKVVSLARELASRESVDADRISVVGFSMGAIGGWQLMTKYRDVFSAFVPIAGDVRLIDAEALAGFPVWAFHGEVDQWVPHANIREAARRGLLTNYTEFPGVDHGSWKAALETPGLSDWLLGRRR